MSNIEPIVDDIGVLITPAARHTDEDKKHRKLDGTYYFSLADSNGEMIATSQASYSWEKCIALCAFFRDKQRDQALKWWKKRNL